MRKLLIIISVILALTLVACAGSNETTSDVSIDRPFFPQSSDVESTVDPVESSEPESSVLASSDEPIAESSVESAVNESIVESNEPETSKPKYVITTSDVSVVEKSSDDTESNESEIEESSQGSESTESNPIEESNVSDEPVVEVAMNDALKSLGVKTKENKSLVCFDPYGGSDGSITILVLINDGDVSHRSEYAWYSSSVDYNAAKAKWQGNLVCDDANHLILTGGGEDEPVVIPEENVYILFGYILWG